MGKNNKIIILLFIFLVGHIAAQSTDSLSDRAEWDKTKKNSKELISLLKDPFDLQIFKKSKPERSNSGGGDKHSYFYKPTPKGFYYAYFFFPPYGNHGPRITTYQKDSNISGYMDTAEVFIQLACDAKDKDLGKMDLVGSSMKDILKKYGANYLKSSDVLIYQYKNTLLIFSGNDYVKWFKVVILNKPFKNFEEINNAKDLLTYFI